MNKRYLEKRGQIKFNAFCNYITALGYECYSIDRLGISKVDFNNNKAQSNKNWVCIEKNETSLPLILNRRLKLYTLNPFMRIN